MWNWGGIRIEFPLGPDPDRSPDFEKHCSNGSLKWQYPECPTIAKKSSDTVRQSDTLMINNAFRVCGTQIR